MTTTAWLTGVLFAFLPMIAVGIWKSMSHLQRTKRKKVLLPASQGLADLTLQGKAVLVRRLRSRLWRTQEKRGSHSGEFGRGLRVEEETHYRAVEEALDKKPRLYLTFWALREASRSNKTRILGRAAKSFATRFPEGAVSIIRPAQRGVSPVGIGKAYSVRHSIKLAHCWLLLPGYFPAKDRSLNSVLNVDDAWIVGTGAFRSIVDVNEPADLWSTAYAINLYYDIERYTSLCILSAPSLSAMVTELETLWRIELVRPSGDIPSEQTLLLIAHEIGKAVQKESPSFAEEVREWLLGFVGPTGTPDTRILDRSVAVTQASTSIRLAYALYCFGANANYWQSCLEHGLRLSDQYLSTSDLAMTIELVSASRGEYDNRTSAVF